MAFETILSGEWNAGDVLYGAHDSHFVSTGCNRKRSHPKFDELDMPCVGGPDAGGDHLVGG